MDQKQKDIEALVAKAKEILARDPDNALAQMVLDRLEKKSEKR